MYDDFLFLFLTHRTMFPPESPPPSKYRPKKPAKAPPQKKEAPWLRIVLQVLFIFIAVGILVALVLYGPKKKNIVCDRNAQAQGSLTAFGSCTSE